MPLKFQKSACNPPEPDIDGIRIVATRFWLRGLKKAAADLYLPDTAPSEGFMRALQNNEVSWRNFAKAYRAEMKSQKSHI